MIGKLSGKIDSFHGGQVVLNVGGVGYLVFASARTLSQIGKPGDSASLLIDTHVREDHIHLYGFLNRSEQEWFRLLTSVQGVGAKVALAILSICPPERLALAISAQDKSAVQAAEGVGPKLAMRVVTELKDKALKMEMASGIKAAPSLDDKGSHSAAPESNGDNDSLHQDAISALVNLGYQRSEAYEAVLRARSLANDNLQTLIRAALKELSA